MKMIESEKIRMIGDNVYVGTKKVGTYKNGVFETMRDPSKHTFIKLNAYGFNVDVLNEMKKYRPETSIVKVKQKGTKIQLIARVLDILENGVYLVFNGEKQVFYPKEKFSIAI